MANKKKKLLSDEIADYLQPQELQDPEREEDETAAQTKFSTYSDEEEHVRPQTKILSDFRRKNVKDITKIDKKYKGEVVSRAELDKSYESSDSMEEDEEGDSNSEQEESSVEEESEFEDASEDNDDGTDDDDDEVKLESDEDNEQNGFQTLQPTNLKENIEKGTSVKNQLQIWEKLLEIRIKSQKLVQNSNSLPVGEVYEELVNNEEFKESVKEASNTLKNLVQKMLELKSTLLQNYPETRGLKRKHSDDPLDMSNEAFKEYRNNVLRKWHDRVRVTTSKGKQGDAQDIIERIQDNLINRVELIKKVQTYRGGYQIIGKSDIEEGQSFEGIYDDADFYHNLLRELIESKTDASDNQEYSEKLIELQSLRSKMKKKIDTRASKGRKVRYVVHNKLVNFMAPVPNDSWTEEMRTELFNSLFDKANS